MLYNCFGSLDGSLPPSLASDKQALIKHNKMFVRMLLKMLFKAGGYQHVA